jgi:hypothetical protein
MVNVKVCDICHYVDDKLVKADYVVKRKNGGSAEKADVCEAHKEHFKNMTLDEMRIENLRIMSVYFNRATTKL